MQTASADPKAAEALARDHEKRPDLWSIHRALAIQNVDIQLLGGTKVWLSGGCTPQSAGTTLDVAEIAEHLVSEGWTPPTANAGGEGGGALADLDMLRQRTARAKHVESISLEIPVDAADRIIAALAAQPTAQAEGGAETYQTRVGAWMDDVFTAGGADTRTRIDRFLEEAFELAQALDYEPGRIEAIRDYVFARPVGEKGQEMGGVMVTLASLAHAADIDLMGEAERELERIHRPEVRAKIMAKQASKNALHTPLPTAEAALAGNTGALSGGTSNASMGDLAGLNAPPGHPANSAARTTSTPPIAASADAGLSGEDHISVADGKYTVILRDSGSSTALRYGKPWPAYEGKVQLDNLTVALARDLQAARASTASRPQVEALRKAVEREARRLLTWSVAAEHGPLMPRLLGEVSERLFAALATAEAKPGAGEAS